MSEIDYIEELDRKLKGKKMKRLGGAGVGISRAVEVVGPPSGLESSRKSLQ